MVLVLLRDNATTVFDSTIFNARISNTKFPSFVSVDKNCLLTLPSKNFQY
jgi:hypothetical protein